MSKGTEATGSAGNFLGRGNTRRKWPGNVHVG